MALRGRVEQPATPDSPPPPSAPPPARGQVQHPDIVRHAAAAFNARVTNVVKKNRPQG